MNKEYTPLESEPETLKKWETITVKPTKEHIYVKDNKDLVFYRRNFGKTDPLNGKKLLDYVKVKEGKYNKKPKNL